MKKIRITRVMFFSIFLSLMYGSFIYVYGQNGYEVGTNKITREIYFRLLVQDSLLVVPENVNLDFGDILKGSTDTKHAETKINIEAGKDVKNVKATYDTTGQAQKDGTTKIQIKYQEEEKPQKQYVHGVQSNSEGKEVDTIDVYLLPFAKDYPLRTEQDKNIGEIPVKGEIRGIGDAKLGKYAGTIKVKVEVVTTNSREEVIE